MKKRFALYLVTLLALPLQASALSVAPRPRAYFYVLMTASILLLVGSLVFLIGLERIIYQRITKRMFTKKQIYLPILLGVGGILLSFLLHTFNPYGYSKETEKAMRDWQIMEESRWRSRP